MKRPKADRPLHWLDWYASAASGSRRMREAAGKTLAAHAAEMEKATRRLFSGVVTPASLPGGRGGGRWEEGRWGLGPLALRDYRLFIPPGVSASRPAPLLVLLHGCGQDAASLAACTRAASLARAERFAVLLPEQSSHASPQRCWNWYGPEPRVAMEAMILMAIVERVCYRYPLRRDKLFALGISAGGAMALTLALRYPDRFRAVGSHSGAAPFSAANAVQAGQVMRGRRGPRIESLRLRLFGACPPPLILLHGGADYVVAAHNAQATARLWLNLLPEPAAAGRSRDIRRGRRRPHAITDWTLAGKTHVRLVDIQGLGHAWSGGAPGQAFSDPTGPDALKLAWRFFKESNGRGVKRALAAAS